MKDLVGSSLLQLVYRQSRRIVLGMCLIVIYIGYILSSNMEGNLWLWWTASTITIYLLRPYIIWLLCSTDRLTIKEKLICTGMYNVVCGGALGVCAFFFPNLELAERLLITILFSGFVAGASISSAGYAPLFLCTVVSCAGPIGIAWVMNPGGYLDSRLSIGLGGFTALLIIL